MGINHLDLTFNYNLGLVAVEDHDDAQGVHLSADFLPNILGYIPIVGILVGIIRISEDFHENSASDSSDKCIGVIRGICEILGIGILFLLLDLVISLAIYIQCKIIQHKNNSDNA